MADHDLGRALRQQVPLVDTDVEGALDRVRRAGRSRVERRRRLVVGAPIAVAAITAVVVLLVALSGGRATVHPAVSPTSSPTSTTAASVWFRHVAGSSGTAPLNIGSVWVVRLSSPTLGTFDVRPNDRFGRGTFRYNAARRVWVVDVLGRYCNNRPGLYALTHVGGALLFTKVDDPCAPRATVLASGSFAPLTSSDQLNG